jgi:hypothetical protein
MESHVLLDEPLAVMMARVANLRDNWQMTVSRYIFMLLEGFDTKDDVQYLLDNVCTPSQLDNQVESTACLICHAMVSRKCHIMDVCIDPLLISSIEHWMYGIHICNNAHTTCRIYPSLLL